VPLVSKTESTRRITIILSPVDLTALVIAGLVFCLDLLTPTGVAVGVLYVAPVFSTVRSPRPNSTVQLSAICSLLVLIGAFPLPTTEALGPFVITNRLLALFTIWVTALLVRNYRRNAAEMARLAAIVTSSDDAIIGIALDGRIDTWNAGAERLYGYSAEEIKKQPITVLLPDDRKDELTGILARLKQGDHIQHFETVRKTKSGELRHVAVTISPIVDDQGRVLGASKISQDITEDKEAREERARLLNELQAALAKVKRLEGFLPVCSSCKKIRDDGGQWVPFERYITEHSEAVFSHGYCPACFESTMQQLRHKRA